MEHIHIADDHPLFRQALLSVIQARYPETHITESIDLDSTIELLEKHPDLDMLLLDLTMPGSTGLLGLVKIRELFADLPLIVVSAREDESTIVRCLGHGASGYISKSASPEQIGQAIDAIECGERWAPGDLLQRPIRLDRATEADDRNLAANIAKLTSQQFKVLCHLKEGSLNKQIAYEMHVTEATVKAHITAIFKKLGLTNRTQVAVKLAHFDLDDVDANS